MVRVGEREGVGVVLGEGEENGDDDGEGMAGGCG